jgi:3-oxoacyl-[acyl-carrier-protein] synthase-3
MKSQIIGIGSCVPDKIVTNADMEQWMDTSDEWIRTRSGIEERHWVEEGQTTSDLAETASRKAMEMAGVTAEEIDLVIVGTITPDYFFPGISAQLQDKLNLRNIGAFDIKAACSAFIYSMSIGDQFIRSGNAKSVLVVGAEVQSTALDISDEGRDTAVLFGDGAGAAILQATEDESGILSTHLHCQGKHLKMLWCEEPGSTNNPRMSEDLLKQNRHYPMMNGREVFKNAITRFPEVINEAMEANQLSMDDVALIIPHQANLRISQAVAKRMGVGMEKVYSNIHKYGNTTAASIPIALCEVVEKGKISKGDIIIFAAFGAGFTWASAAVKW